MSLSAAPRSFPEFHHRGAEDAEGARRRKGREERGATRSACALLPAFLLPVLAGGGDDDWPRWRGARFDDATRAGGVLDGPFELVVRWRRAIGSGYSGISVRGATAVTMAAEGGSDWVLALDAATGAERWRARVGDAFPGLDGAADGPVSTPSIDTDTVYALGPRGELLALELASGERRWSVDLAATYAAPRPHWGFTTAPLLVEDAGLVVVAAGGPDGRAFVALDAASGETRWTAGDDAIHYHSPILAEVGGEELVVGAGNSFLFGIEPATGDVRWRAKHDGADFYREILQPLALGDDDFLLKHQRGLSARVHVDADSGALMSVWRSRHLRGNYNMSVHHEGLLFGHGGTFLSCVDAYTGELLWRSRPPGDGWVILVDGHLVVLTKAGSLHVAAASPEGYEERAALELLEHLTWTPPSFAGGRVFARDSLRDAACVEVVPRERPVARTEPPEPHEPPALFRELAGRVAASDDPNEVVDEFLAAQSAFPIVEAGVPDRSRATVHFVHRASAQDLVVRGDFLADEEVLPMRRVPGTDLFHATVELPRDARVGYQLVRDLDEALADPLNPATTPSITMLGPVSALVLPGAAPLPGPQDAAHAGTRESFTIDVPVSDREGRPWGGPRRVWVHLPPGYGDGDRRYPVLYVNDGASALDPIGLPAILDALAGERMEPTIAVFVEMQGSYELARAEQDLYRDLLVERVVPEIDALYRTRAEPAARAVLGWDEGAYAALFAGLSRPDVLGRAAAQSLYHGSSQGQGVLEALVRGAETLPAVHLDWGRLDSRDPKRAQDAPAQNRALAALLGARGATVVARETTDGDQVAFWRARLPALLAGLFPPRE